MSVLLGALLWLLVQVGSLYREVGRLAGTDSFKAFNDGHGHPAGPAAPGGRNRTCADLVEAAEAAGRAQG